MRIALGRNLCCLHRMFPQNCIFRTSNHSHEEYTTRSTDTCTQPAMYTNTYVHGLHFLTKYTMTISSLVHTPLPISWLEKPFPGHCPLRSLGSQLQPGSPHRPLRTHCYLESSTPHESAESMNAEPVSRLLPQLLGHGEHHHHHRPPTERKSKQIILIGQTYSVKLKGYQHTQQCTLPPQPDGFKVHKHRYERQM